MSKSHREIMEILEALDLTHSAEAAARLMGCAPKTVRYHVAPRDTGLAVGEPVRRERIIDPFLEKVEELVERARGDIRADVAHREHLVPMGFAGDERTTRRAVAEAKGRLVRGPTPHLSAVDPRARHEHPPVHRTGWL